MFTFSSFKPFEEYGDNRKRMISLDIIIGRTGETHEKLKRRAHVMEINVEKTKEIEVKTRLDQNQNIGDDDTEVVQNGRYLGSKINETKDMTQEIRNRKMKGNRALSALQWSMKRVLNEQFGGNRNEGRPYELVGKTTFRKMLSYS